ncbi:MAG: hypothetical protein ACC742_05295 [Thermoanaerobaculales bacterium]
MRKITMIVGFLSLSAVLASPLAAHGGAEAGGTVFEQIMSHYEAIHASLAGDTIEGVAEHAGEIQRIARETASSFSAGTAGVATGDGKECQSLLPEVEGSAKTLVSATTLENARLAFAELSRPLVRYREMVSGERPNVVFCSMAKKPWLQDSDVITNPYYGSKMLRCGDIVSN